MKINDIISELNAVLEQVEEYVDLSTTVQTKESFDSVIQENTNDDYTIDEVQTLIDFVVDVKNEMTECWLDYPEDESAAIINELVDVHDELFNLLTLNNSAS